jgi:hypothetical protein
VTPRTPRRGSSRVSGAAKLGMENR